MSGPWENYQAESPSVEEGPWTKYTSVEEEKPQSLKDIYNTEDFQRLSEDKQRKIIKDKMVEEGKINEYGYQSDSIVPSAIQKLIPTERNVKLERKFGYEFAPETQARRKEVYERGLAAPISGMQNVVASGVNALSDNPDIKAASADVIKGNRAEQASLDELQSRTPDTEGAQTLPQIGASLPLAAIKPAQAAVRAADTFGTGGGVIGGWLKSIGMGIDTSIQGAAAGKTLPTSSARATQETPEEAVARQAKESTGNAEIGAATGALPIVAKAGGEVINKVVPPAMNMAKAVTGMGAKGEAETRAAKDIADAYSSTRGREVAPQEIAGEIQAGKDKETAINKEYGTSFNFTTPQASGDRAMQEFHTAKESNVSLGLASANKAGSETIANTATQEGKNQEELAKLIGQTKQTLTADEAGAVQKTAKEVGENPFKYVTDTYKPVDFNDMDKVIAGKKLVVGRVEEMEAGKARYDELYNGIDPKGTVKMAAPSTRKAIEENLADLNEYGLLTKADKKILSDFYGEAEAAGTNLNKNTARELVELNANLSDLAQRARSDPKLAPAYEAVQAIRAATKLDLANSPIKSVASRAKEANELYKTTIATLYERPEKFLGKPQATALAELRNKAGAKTSLEDEKAVTNLVGTSEDIADIRRGSNFVKGNTQEVDRDVKNYLMSDLKDTMRSNPTPATFDTWVAKNATKVGAIPEFKRELLGLKAALVKEEQNIATAQKLMGGKDNASKAVKDAMGSSEKMQALVDLAKKDTTGNTRKGLQQLFQEHIEDALNTVQRKGSEQSGTKIAESTQYFKDLLDNPETQKALKVLWEGDANSLNEAAQLFKRLDMEHVGRIPKPPEGAVEGAAKGIVAQTTGARTLTISGADRVFGRLHNREYNRVLAKAMTDKDYAMSILKAYREPTEANISALVEAVTTLSVPSYISSKKSSGKVNPELAPKEVKVPKAATITKEKPQSKAKEETNSLLSMLNPISDAEAADKVPYNEDYSKMLGKLASNDHRHLANYAIEEAHAQGVDPKLAINIANAESNFKHDAKAKTSSAKGLFQITEGTAKEIKNKLLKTPKLDLNDPKNNIKAGVAYAKDISDKIQKVTGKKPEPYLVYTGYHSGMTGVLTLLNPANQKKAAAALMPDAAKANKTIYFNPNGKPYTVIKVRQNLKDYYESKRLDK